MFLIGRAVRGENTPIVFLLCTVPHRDLDLNVICLSRRWASSLNCFLSSSLVFFIFVTECTHTQKVSTKTDSHTLTHAGVYNRIKKKRKGKKWFIPEGQFSFCGPPAAHVCYNHRHHQSIVIGGDYCNAASGRANEKNKTKTKIKKTRIWSMNRLSAW